MALDVAKDRPKVSHMVEMRDPGELKPHPKNTRKHSPQQIDMIAASLEKFGFAKPVLIDEDDTILAGHGAVAAALKVGMQVPTVVAVNWSEDDKRSYLIADNRLGERSRWDYNLLAVELEGLKRVTDIAALGFTKAELTTALRRANATPPPVGVLGSGMTYRVIVDCTDERHQSELLDRFAQEGLTCRALIS